jgi:cyclophilin family peptidyl-prolyl cis-trans isomerase
MIKINIPLIIFISFLVTCNIYAQKKEVLKLERVIKPDFTAKQRVEIAIKYKDVPVKVNENDTFLIRTNKGDFKIVLYPKDAPKTCENFKRLVMLGFYDGLTFHRYVEGFVIQGGDPEGTGMGSSGVTVPLEAKASHIEGAVGLARAEDKNSGSCQFYITLAPQKSLDGSYTVFGKVISGMDVVKKLRAKDKIEKIELISGKPK